MKSRAIPLDQIWTALLLRMQRTLAAAYRQLGFVDTDAEAVVEHAQAEIATGEAPAQLLRNAIASCKKGIWAVVVFSFVANLLMLTGPLYMLQIYDRVLTSGSTETLLYLTLIAAFALLIVWGLEIVRGRILLELGSWLERRLGGPVLALCLERSDQSSPLAIKDVERLRMFISGPAATTLLDAPWTPIFLGVIFLLHPSLGWLALAGAGTLLLFAWYNERATRQSTLKAAHLSGQAHEAAATATRNFDTVRAMGMVPALVTRWRRRADRGLGEHLTAGRKNLGISASSKLLRQLLQIGLLGFGAFLVLNNELSGGGMIAASILMSRALAPVEQLIASWRNVVVGRLAFNRIARSLSEGTAHESAHRLPQPRGEISLENVSFAYPGSKAPLLRNLSLALQPGEALALVGPTAAGKSTLARLLVGTLKPQIGHVRIDGGEITQWNAEDRRQHIGYLPQHVELFEGSIFENIARLSTADPEAVYAAAKLAGAHEDILALPQGYDTQVGPEGLTLSGGQRQRIGLARAICGDPKVAILDEPNSYLDSHGERALLGTLAHLRNEGATIVVVAHQPNLLAGADKVMLVRNGTVEILAPEARAKTSKAPRRPGAGTARQGTMSAQIRLNGDGAILSEDFATQAAPNRQSGKAKAKPRKATAKRSSRKGSSA